MRDPSSKTTKLERKAEKGDEFVLIRAVEVAVVTRPSDRGAD
jgi:hypothetical protein